mmetsp:Transcript_26432/g.72975  ORF Transcript_26432/g.72975 Transcript_26432/m.72975 type:complete len:107 (-) Transcript_26432:420-740(-)
MDQWIQEEDHFSPSQVETDPRKIIYGMQCSGELVLPALVESMDLYAFCNCPSLTQVTFHSVRHFGTLMKNQQIPGLQLTTYLETAVSSHSLRALATLVGTILARRK